jgi:hypothetical protein
MPGEQRARAAFHTRVIMHSLSQTFRPEERSIVNPNRQAGFTITSIMKTISPPTAQRSSEKNASNQTIKPLIHKLSRIPFCHYPNTC